MNRMQVVLVGGEEVASVDESMDITGIAEGKPYCLRYLVEYLINYRSV